MLKWKSHNAGARGGSDTSRITPIATDRRADPSNMSARTSEQISDHMRRIRKRDTKPERVVRRVAHRLGYRYRLHRRDLPGTPDLIFPSRRKVVLVHGCFWHQHQCPLGSKQPRANAHYWLPKLARNRERDLAVERALRQLGWSVMVIWECETRDDSAVAVRLRRFLQ
jgi:DNA mismatch endonuclease (patch repair protein)